MKKRYYLTGALVLLLALVAFVAFASADQPAATSAAQAVGLEGPRWVLVSYTDQGGKTAPALPDVEATAQFENGRVGGSAGCNTFTAPYEVKGASLTIGMGATTMRMCSPQIMDQEAAYLANLQAAASYKIAGDQLTIANAKGANVLTFRAEQPISLTDGAWVLTSHNNGRAGVVSGVEDSEVTAVFGADGQLSGSAGCNRYNAAYTVDGDTIEIGAPITTRMMCPQPIMDQEAQYLAAIQLAARYNIEGTRLELRSADEALQASYVHQAAVEEQPATTAASTPAARSLQDTYITLRPMADGGVATIVLHLDPDGKAEFATSSEEEAPIVQTGAWQDNGDGTITVTLAEQDGRKLAKPVVFKFESDGAYLSAVEYDQAVYGEEGLKLAQAADVARKVGVGLVTLDLEAGFPLDPTFVSVNGGGEVDASLLSQDCRGFINRNPVVTVHWTGAADLVRAFFYSDSDATLVVLTPDGELVCNDNANGQLLDPVLEIKDPTPGTYRMWVGSTAARQLVPGILVLTSKPDVNLDSFDLTKLVRRPMIPVTLPQPAPQVDTTAVQKAIGDAIESAPVLKAGVPITAEVTAAGDVPLFQFPVTKTCAGLVSPTPSFVFTVSGQPKQVNVFFEGDADATLLVLGNDGKIVECSDDAEAGANINPIVGLANPPAGAYAVYVGRLSPTQPITGTLTITDAADAQPAVLAPAKQ